MNLRTGRGHLQCSDGNAQKSAGHRERKHSAGPQSDEERVSALTSGDADEAVVGVLGQFEGLLLDLLHLLARRRQDDGEWPGLRGLQSVTVRVRIRIKARVL